MKNLSHTGIFLYSVLLLFTNQSKAFVYDGTSPLLENKNSCLFSPRACLDQIDENIGKTKNNSRQWYRLINLKLLATWEIRDIKALKEEIHKYVDLHHAPPVFLTTVYTLWAKLLLSDGDLEQGALYANKSVELIKEVNEVSFDADRYAEIILLYNRLNQYDNAIEFITWINQRISRMGPTHYFSKLQTAIAHTYLRIVNYDAALQHYRDALTGFIATKHLLETAETHHNIARALQSKKQYSQAIAEFKKALKWMNTAVELGNYTIEARNYTQLRLIETLKENGQYLQAKLLLKEVNPAKVNQSTLDLYQQLKRDEHNH
ncbi:MAG: hypothetical protein AXW17_07815 [Colwellia sp. Phe_37]|nr:MAG: hypothetical protein AXW17_07815 [Colwellia sp. Phe_37]